MLLLLFEAGSIPCLPEDKRLYDLLVFVTGVLELKSSSKINVWNLIYEWYKCQNFIQISNKLEQTLK